MTSSFFNCSEDDNSTMSCDSKASVVLVGCGAPKRSMGWYHAVQMLDEERQCCPSASLKYIVEPWYMSEAGKNSPGSEDFATWKKALEDTKGIQFFEHVEQVPSPPADGERRMAIISARTVDNPRLFAECLSIGCHSIYLEKPGAATVRELEQMRDDAKKAGVTVMMGFNKNVAKYSSKTMEEAAKGGTVTFVHNNNYSKDQLGECFERNSEGMLKNMAIHELALLVTFYNVTTDTIVEVVADSEFSSCQTLKGPSGKEFTDFDKLKFTVKTKEGSQVSVAADRCGGYDSVGIVMDDIGRETFRYSMPDEEDKANIAKLAKKYPDAMPYFYVQDADYATLKERIARNCFNRMPAEGVATIDVAVETMKIAEYLTPLLQEQLLDE